LTFHLLISALDVQVSDIPNRYALGTRIVDAMKKELWTERGNRWHHQHYCRLQKNKGRL